MHSRDDRHLAKIIGRVAEWRELTTTVGNKMGVLWLVTDAGETRVWVYPDLYPEVKGLIASDLALSVKGQWEQTDTDMQFLATGIVARNR